MKKLCEQYALALYELSEENKCEDLILTQMQEICRLLEQNPEYVRMLDNPTLEKSKRTELAKEAFDKADEYLKNLIMLLVEARHLNEFKAITESFSRLFDNKHNILRARALTAIKLDEEQKSAISKKLEELTGKTVILENTVDTSLVGGVLLKYGSKQINMSVRSELDTLAQMINQADV